MRNINELLATLKAKDATSEITKLSPFNVEGVNPDTWTNEILANQKDYPIAYSIIMEGLKSSNSEGWQTLVGTEFIVTNYQVKTLSNGSTITLAVLSDGRRISVNKSFVSTIEADGSAKTLYVSDVDKAEIKEKDGGTEITKVYASCSLTIDPTKALPSAEVLEKIKSIANIEHKHLQKWEKALKVDAVQPMTKLGCKNVTEWKALTGKIISATEFAALPA